MPHPDSVLIRRMLCGPIGSAKLHELSPSANNPASDLTETTRSSVGVRAGATLPASAFQPPRAEAGPSLYVFPHTEDY